MPNYDVIFVLPYPFSDHPSFPEGILKRVLESKGFSVGVLEKPFRHKKESFTVLGRPNLFFAIIPGPVDSTVLNYTSSRKRRVEDQYQIGGNGFFEGYPPSIKYRIRPDNTAIAYTNRIRENYKDTPIIIGGVEASLRQFAHYDFQQDKIRRSILFDSRADLLVTGAGEKQIIAIAENLRDGKRAGDLKLRGTSGIVKDIAGVRDSLELPSMENILQDKNNLVKAFLMKERGTAMGKTLCQKNGDRYVVSYPAETYSGEELDLFFSFGYQRSHPGRIDYSPALRMNLFSITSHRGCGGGCTFCSISLNEGKKVISRSEGSILEEARTMMKHRSWKGVISDVGGPSAEMYGYSCAVSPCPKNSCLAPRPCPSLQKGDRYLSLLRQLRRLKGVRKVFIGSGVRYDNLTGNPELLGEILEHHSGKYLRIAPEHTEDAVLTLMRKPGLKALTKFMGLYSQINEKLNRKITAAPYLIIGHPGETPDHVKEMKKKIRSLNMSTAETQIFTPTPGTLSTAMYYAETDPDGNSLPVEKNIKELIKRKNFLASG